MKTIKEKTKTVFGRWMNVYGIAPNSVVNKLEAARLDWIIELTECLEIWADKGITMTNGELLLARANLGALVEGWIKFFYCVYYDDYERGPITNKGEMVEPNDLRFESLKVFSRGKLWNKNSKWDFWVEDVQQKRNALHAFNTRDIGSPCSFLEDLEKFNCFIDVISNRLPDTEY